MTLWGARPKISLMIVWGTGMHSGVGDPSASIKHVQSLCISVILNTAVQRNSKKQKQKQKTAITIILVRHDFVLKQDDCRNGDRNTGSEKYLRCRICRCRGMIGQGRGGKWSGCQSTQKGFLVSEWAADGVGTTCVEEEHVSGGGIKSSLGTCWICHPSDAAIRGVGPNTHMWQPSAHARSFTSWGLAGSSRERTRREESRAPKPHSQGGSI